MIKISAIHIKSQKLALLYLLSHPIMECSYTSISTREYSNVDDFYYNDTIIIVHTRPNNSFLYAYI